MKPYTKAQRKLIHKQLVAAVPYLATKASDREYGKYRFICFAISHASGRGYCDVFTIAETMIQERLGGISTVAGWLLDQGIPDSELTGENLQAYRHRWLAAMIEEFSA